jgi:hypothetical protein
MKIGCIIQGDIRRGSNYVLDYLPKLFDYTVLSTWDSNQTIPRGNFDVISNKKPKIAGFSNRNLQRFSTARGLDAIKAAKCDFVLKWRTDMVPSQIKIKQLLDWAHYSLPAGISSRIVVPAFRNISIVPDTFSTIPDLFAFGHIDEIDKLWGDDDFDYSKNFNISPNEDNLLDLKKISTSQIKDVYCAEAELYALYKSKLSIQDGRVLDHKFIARNYLRLIDHRRLGILWFSSESGFRSIGQAWEHPWWTEKNWEKGNAKVYPYGYHSSGLLSKIKKKISNYKIYSEIKTQEKIWQNMNF